MQRPTSPGSPSRSRQGRLSRADDWTDSPIPRSSSGVRLLTGSTWRQLAGRDTGKEGYVRGDLKRALSRRRAARRRYSNDLNVSGAGELAPVVDRLPAVSVSHAPESGERCPEGSAALKPEDDVPNGFARVWSRPTPGAAASDGAAPPSKFNVSDGSALSVEDEGLDPSPPEPSEPVLGHGHVDESQSVEMDHDSSVNLHSAQEGRQYCSRAAASSPTNATRGFVAVGLHHWVVLASLAAVLALRSLRRRFRAATAVGVLFAAARWHAARRRRRNEVIEDWAFESMQIELESELVATHSDDDSEDEPRPADLPKGLDWKRLRKVRQLCKYEAHLRAAALLEDYLAEVRASGSQSLEQCLECFIVQDEGLRRMRYKAASARAALEHLKSESRSGPQQWTTYNQVGRRGKDMVELWSRKDTDGAALIRVRSTIPQAFWRQVSLFYEVDLWKQWLPFVGDVRCLHTVEGGGGDYAQFILLAKFKFPWPISDRESVLFGFGCDALDEGKLIISAKSVPEDAVEWWGYPLPPATREVKRMSCDFMIIMEPVGENMEATQVDMILKVDFKVDWLPQSFTNVSVKHFVKNLFTNVGNICTDFDKSPYQPRIEADDRGFYELVQKALEFRKQGQLAEASSPQI